MKRMNVIGLLFGKLFGRLVSGLVFTKGVTLQARHLEAQ